MPITTLMKQLVQVRSELEQFGIRDSGGYAEALVAKAIGAVRNESSVNKGFDLICSSRGKIEVRSRTLPRDGRKETRLEIPKEKMGHFDFLAGVLFDSDISVIGGFLLPHNEAFILISKKRFPRLSFEAGAAHPCAIDITLRLRQAQESI